MGAPLVDRGGLSSASPVQGNDLKTGQMEGACGGRIAVRLIWSRLVSEADANFVAACDFSVATSSGTVPESLGKTMNLYPSGWRTLVLQATLVWFEVAQREKAAGNFSGGQW